MIGADPSLATRAAQLAKADLTTDMVGEFPELQGLMGRYYAEHDHEPPAVAAAIEQHYWPRFAGDALPDTPVAQAVALADKLETLAGMFGIGAQPTGDKDPFGLRRHAIGAIRIVVEKGLRVTLADLVDAAFRAFAGVPAVQDARTELENFIYERLRGYLRDAGYSANQVEAVLCQRPARLDLVPAQAAAVRAFGELPEAETLAAANKRIVNILRKSGSEAAAAVDRARLADGAEHDLYLAFQKLRARRRRSLRDRRFRRCPARAGERQAGRRPVLRRRARDGRRSGDSREPARAAARRGADDEPRRRHLQARRA